uniref:Protein farnesyltransferase subunit beta n=1 Tax=Zooxanthella nutricula TaxID=1333877 RepID=A0A7S2KZX0_9DINO
MTTTSRDQKKTETDVLSFFRTFLAKKGQDDILLNREQHVTWLKKGLQILPTNFCGLDASRPWFVFWISHALEVLDGYDEALWRPKVASFLGRCQHSEGGFGGGPLQLAHLAPTYAAVSAILVGGGDEAYKVVDRRTMYQFLMRMKHPEGGFRMHDEGETDMRGTYCAIAVASMLHILTDELAEGVPEYVRRCQTFEGGIAGEEGLEAHGGYSYCGLAALCILGRAHSLDLHAFLRWAAQRQMGLEGGFQGRTNKLVDSCYSFWQGAIFPLLHEAFRQHGVDVALPERHLWFSPRPLQTYVFLACQHPGGGLRDKPGKSADFYHSCYSLSGVSVSQYDLDGESDVVGDSANRLVRSDAFYNVALEKAERKTAFFEAAGSIEVDGRRIDGREGSGVAIARKYLLARAAKQ